MILDRTTKTIEIVLAASSGVPYPFVVNWTNLQVKGTSAAPVFQSVGVQCADGTTNGTTAVTAVPAPTQELSLRVEWLSVQNADLSAGTLTVQLNNNGALRTLWKGVLQPGDTLMYIWGRGFYVLDQYGEVKGTGSAASSSGSSAGTPTPGTSGGVSAGFVGLWTQPPTGPGSAQDLEEQAQDLLRAILVELRVISHVLVDSVGPVGMESPDAIRDEIRDSLEDRIEPN